MAQKPIREYAGKRLIRNWMDKHNIDEKYNTLKAMYFIDPSTDLEKPDCPFDPKDKLVVKPDQLVKRRGKLGLVQLNKSFDQCIKWVQKKRNNKLKIGNAEGHLNYFLIEPFVAHKPEEELYVCIHSVREGDEILFYHQGGVDVGDVDSKCVRYVVRAMNKPTRNDFISNLLTNPAAKFSADYSVFLGEFLFQLYTLYAHLHFAYMEINPLVVKKDLSGIYILDLAAKLDSCAEYTMHAEWSDTITEFPPFFGHVAEPEEKYVAELDDRSGASLKLTIFGRYSKVWTLVAGGGASVIYADTICDLGYSKALGNYGEYSGAPTKALTHQYAETVIKLLIDSRAIVEKMKDDEMYELNKGPPVLLIGGGIANFTDVASTFAGIIKALEENSEDLQRIGVQIYVRRGGPNFQKGLKIMKECGDNLGLAMKVYGPETHITAIVSMALQHKSADDATKKEEIADANAEALIGNRFDLSKFTFPKGESKQQIYDDDEDDDVDDSKNGFQFTSKTRCIVYGMQARAVQNMLDFDYICRRTKPSVSAIVYRFAAGVHHRQFYWGNKQIMIPVYRDVSSALKMDPTIKSVVNFASSRSAFSTSRDMILNYHSQLRHITIIAEGMPERDAKKLIFLSDKYNVIILGPSTVGGIVAGSFRIGNTGGMLDNIVECKLYRPGSISFVSRSGGLSNELSNIISRCTNGVCEGMAIGGDRYPCTTFMDHLLRYNDNPNCKMLVILGEVGGTLEYDVIEAIKNKKITKPVVAWCTGTCCKYFSYDVQFGHAGALAQSQMETASAKNRALHKAGCFVPESFDDFGRLIKHLYNRLVKESVIVDSKKCQSVEPPPIPLDYHWARKLGMVRKASGFLSGITDERGDELVYAGMPISQIFELNLGVGGVVALLWFRRRVPAYFAKFIEIVLQITADHGPAVSGAHNTIVTARAGKDLISSLCSGLLTIGPRFGGALDGAAKMFMGGYDTGLSAQQFVEKNRKSGKYIMGIGHKIKSLENPDKRVEIVCDFARKHFPKNSMHILDFAKKVERITTRKKSNLILNVDGAIACCFVDLLRSSDKFSKQECDQYIEMGTLNALFVLGRSIGFIAHFLDQKRLKQGLYRHPTDDITYFLSDINTNM